MKKTLVIGASENPERYSYKAVKSLLQHGHKVEAIGKREGSIDGVGIQKGQPVLENIDTVTVYLNERNQQEYYDYLLALKPKRVIFNPGAENPALEILLKKSNVEVVEACTLVMLSIGSF